MPACHASHVFAEEIDLGQRCTQAVTSDTLRAVLETWCDHELRWSCMGTIPLPSGPSRPTPARVPRDVMGVRGPPGGQSQGGLFRGL
jgi:hypothetical protein